MKLKYRILLLLVSSHLFASNDYEKARFVYDALNTGELPIQLLQLAEDGDIESQFLMGEFYRQKESSYQDLNQALNWYLKAAEQDHVDAIREVAVFYSAGVGGLARNCQKSIELYEKLLDMKEISVWQNLAWHLATCEVPTARNPKKAMKLFTKYMKESDLSVGSLDTLAAVHAVSGNFADAITLQKLVVSLLSDQSNHPDRVKKMNARLDLYQAGKIWTGWSYEKPDEYAE